MHLQIRLKNITAASCNSITITRNLDRKSVIELCIGYSTLNIHLKDMSFLESLTELLTQSGRPPVVSEKKYRELKEENRSQPERES